MNPSMGGRTGSWRPLEGAAAVSSHIAQSSQDRLMRTLDRARLILGGSAFVVVFLIPGLAHRAALATAIGVAYLPFVVWSQFPAGRRGALGRMLHVGGDIVGIFAITLATPDVQVVALTGYTVFVVFFAVARGPAVGLVLAALAAVAAVVARALNPQLDQPDAYALSMFAVALVVFVLIIDRALAERRATEAFLARLQAAVNSLSDHPGLSDILESVAETAGGAVDAKFVSVLVRDDEGVFQAALNGDIGPDSPGRSAEMIERIMADPAASPSGLALTTGQRVVVPEIATDPRFAHWVDETQRQHFTSTIAVPLRSGSRVIGVLSAYLRSPDDVKPESVELLSAYADQVTVIVLRALAYEHEKRAAERLAEADRLKSDLVATVSHELRTPLTSVKGFLETVLRHWERFEESERREMLERSLHNADLLADLIDQVLDYSRLEAQAVDVELHAWPIADQVERALERMGPITAGHHLEVDVPAGLWAILDPHAFERILVNLVSNACRYSEAGSVVRITARPDGDEVVVAVADEGIGIPPEEHDRIFERFYRVGVGIQARRGTGVGLAIVKRYLDLVGGRIWIDSEVGHGSTFSVALRAADAPARAGQEREPAAADPETSDAVSAEVPDGRPVSSPSRPRAAR